MGQQTIFFILAGVSGIFFIASMTLLEGKSGKAIVSGFGSIFALFAGFSSLVGAGTGLEAAVVERVLVFTSVSLSISLILIFIGLIQVVADKVKGRGYDFR